MALVKRGQKQEAKLRVKKIYILIFDAKLRFALQASLCSTIFYRTFSGQLNGPFTRKG